MSTDQMGRLSQPPDPLLFSLLYEPHLERDRQEVLPHLLQIDAAHVLMLAERGLLAWETAAPLLAINRELAARRAAGEPLLPAEGRHRGLYWLYEQEFIDRLGAEVGGAAHLARSRNDVNATVLRMRLRGETLDLLAACDGLSKALAARAAEHAATLMSSFTHLQPAQPSTFGHYLAGVLSEVQRSAEWVLESYAVLNLSPMGAAAGIGTSFPIDRGRVADCLGFAGVLENSADAVASRDFVVRLLSAAATLGTTLTRMALDLQSWGSFAYGFLDWPDALVSTSSIMPQKRNAFVWENVRGQAGHPLGALVVLLAGLKNTPFANGIEAGTEAIAGAFPALAALRRALALTALLIEKVEVRAERMRRFLADAETTMTALADHLVARHGLSFRCAHDLVGALLQEIPAGAGLDAESAGTRLAALSASRLGRELRLDGGEIAAALDPERCMLAARYGGGPAPGSVGEQLAHLAARREALAAASTAHRRQLGEAERRLASAVDAVLAGSAQPGLQASDQAPATAPQE